MSSPDPVLLREQLCADPGDQDLRQQYLACRTPELLARDRRCVLLAVVAVGMVAGAVVCGLLGVLVGSMGSGMAVVSIGSVHIDSRPGKMEVRSHGIAAVSRGGGVQAAVLCGLSLMPAGAILGVLAGLVAGVRLAPPLAVNGPWSWWQYRVASRSRKSSPAEATDPLHPIANLFLVHPQSGAFLRGEAVRLPGRPSWWGFVQDLVMAGVVLGMLQIMQREEPPIPERFLEAPWHPAPLPALLAFAAGFVFLLLRAPFRFAQWRRGRLLERTGDVVYGQVVEWLAERRSATDPESGRACSCWQVQLRYEFTSPTRTITDEIRFERAELLEDAPLAPGTPVAVLYAADQLYQIL